MMTLVADECHTVSGDFLGRCLHRLSKGEGWPADTWAYTAQVRKMGAQGVFTEVSGLAKAEENKVDNYIIEDFHAYNYEVLAITHKRKL